MALRAFGSLFVEAMGSSPPRILALHGWGRRGSDFGPSLQGFDVFAPDLPGFGASPPPDTVIGAHGYATILEPLLDEFPGPMVLVGHSFGGRVAVCLADEHPDRIKRLILSGVPLLRTRPARKPSLRYRAARQLNQLGVLSDERLEAKKRRSGSADYRAAEGVMRDILVKVINETYEGQLQRLRVPVDLLWGSNDSEVPVEVAEEAMKLVEQSGGTVSLRVLESVGHHTPLQADGELRHLVKEALAS